MNTSNSPENRLQFTRKKTRTAVAGVMALALAAGSSLALAGGHPTQREGQAVPVGTQQAPAADQSNKAAPDDNVLVVETETFVNPVMDPLAALDLSDKQVNKITDINDNARKEMWKLQGAEMDAKNKLRDLYADEDFDADAIMKANHTLAALHEKMVNTRTDARTRIYDVLTPEQRAMI